MAVLDLDLAAPLAPPCLHNDDALARVLVRSRSRPVAWITVPVDAGTCDDAALGRALVAAAPALAAGAVRARQAEKAAVPLPPMSVVICTRDRSDSLARCLESIARLDYPVFEVVVVDNAPSTDETRRVAARHRVRYVEEPTPGLDWARNRGIAESAHELIAFTDDDVRVDPGWLRGLARGFFDDTVGLVTGFVAPGSLATRAERLFELSYGGMGKGFAPRTLRPAAMDAFRLIATHHLGVGANMAVRRDALARVGGFDTALDVGTPSHGGGDLDFFHRVLVAGWAVHYEPSAVIWHYHRSTTARLRRQMYDNGRAFGAYLLTRFRERRLPRSAVTRYTLHWLLWLLGRIPRRFLRRERMPIPYLASELWGALHAPWGYFRSRRRDRELRARLASDRDGRHRDA